MTTSSRTLVLCIAAEVGFTDGESLQAPFLSFRTQQALVSRGLVRGRRVNSPEMKSGCAAAPALSSLPGEAQPRSQHRVREAEHPRAL